MVLGRPRDQFRESLPQVVIDLQLAIAMAAIEQPIFSLFEKSPRHTHRRRRYAPQVRRDTLCSQPGFIEQHDLYPCPERRVLGLLHLTPQSPLHPAWYPDYNSSVHWGASWMARPRKTRRKHPEALLLDCHTAINHSSRAKKITCGDPESRFPI